MTIKILFSCDTSYTGRNVSLPVPIFKRLYGADLPELNFFWRFLAKALDRLRDYSQMLWLILPPFQPHHPVSPITLAIHIMGSYLFCFMSASESVQGGFLSSCPFVCICISFFKKNQQHLLLFLMGFQGLRLGQAFPSLPAQQPHSIVSLSNLCYKLKSNVIRFGDFDLNGLYELNV